MISAATDPNIAPSGWAFNETSIPLHDELLQRYPTMDSNTDGYISISEANAYTGNISISSSSINGTMEGIGYFTNITKLDIGNTNLTAIPEEIGNLVNLKSLTINGQGIGFKNSSLPESLGNLINLETLSIRNVDMNGSLPSSLGNLVNLRNVSIMNTLITGSIPVGIGNLTSLETLQLSRNQLTGSIPESITKLNILKTLYLDSNQLSGSIPNTIGDMTMLEMLYLANNQLTGSIPESIGNANNITSIYLDNNQLSGSIPDSITKLPLFTLSLNNNQLSGTIPSDIGNNPNLQIFQISNNLITGDIPTSIENLSSLAYFDISNNQISGNIPQGFYQLNSLYMVLLNGNSELSGNLAEGFKNYAGLGIDTLNVSGTNLNQARPDVVDYLLYTFINDNLAANLLVPDKTDIVEGLTQEDIDHAQESCDWIVDSTEKNQWQDDIDLAQKFLDAKKAVEELFTDSSHTDIPDNLTLDDILAAEDIVNTLPEGTVKTDLLEEIEKAKNMLQVKEEVDNLFTDDTHTDIPDDLTLEDILDVEDLLPTIPDGSLKDRLQTEIDKAKDMLNAKDAVDDLYKDDIYTDIIDDLTLDDINNAQDLVDKLDDGSLKDDLQAKIDAARRLLHTQKPTVLPNIDKTITKDMISTSDTTATISLIAILSISLLSIVWLKKRKNEA
jgi:Leucine-rich repeat (LRR) protein/cell division FtsZ-interacting protein ZapD